MTRPLALTQRQAEAIIRAAEATKRQRKSVLNRVLAENMSTPLDAIDREAIIDARDARADTPFAAIDFVKTMRALYKWGTEAGHVD